MTSYKLYHKFCIGLHKGKKCSHDRFQKYPLLIMQHSRLKSKLPVNCQLNGLALGLGRKWLALGFVLVDLYITLRPIYNQFVNYAARTLNLDNSLSRAARNTKGCRDRYFFSWAVMGPTIN